MAAGVTVVDVGCRNADLLAKWLAWPDARVIGFDADEAEIARLRQALPRHEWHARALGARRHTAVFNDTAVPFSSSPLLPRADPELADIAEDLVISAQRTVELWPLDDLAGLPPVDLLKLDVQGYELEVLRGATRTLADVSVIQCEVEFNPIYHGVGDVDRQPLFGDVDAFLRQRGFILQDLRDLHYLGGRLYWADAYYLSRRPRAKEIMERL